ncbi:MAG: serine/threonine protein kinase, partial [Tannerella sp.]|nr:serine/threonine protein kinase [Tannerella sp.]
MFCIVLNMYYLCAKLLLRRILMNLPDGYFLQNKKYQLTHVIGQGGFGITYLGIWNTELRGGLGVMKTKVPVCIKEYFFKDYCYRDKNSYAVKIHSATGGKLFDRFKEKLIKEANILSEVHHPHIVNVLEVFEENNTAYIVMEYIKGCSLKYMLDKEGVLPENKALKYVHQIGNALDFVHDKNIVHLDIKPSNILIGKDDNARLIDFGVSKRYDIDERETSTTTLTLSKGFASIEQYDGEGTQSFSPCPDIYSLGATMYNLLTGVIPVESILRATKRMLPPSSYNVNITKKTEKAILKAMEVKPENRYQVVKEMLAALDIPPYELAENKWLETKCMTDDEFTEPIHVRSLENAVDTDDDRTIPVSSSAKGKYLGNNDHSKKKTSKRFFSVVIILFFSFIGYAIYDYYTGITTSQSMTFEIDLPKRNDDTVMSVQDLIGSVYGESVQDTLRDSEYDERQQTSDGQPPQLPIHNTASIPSSNSVSNNASGSNPASNTKRNPIFSSNQETMRLTPEGTSPEKIVNETPTPEDEEMPEKKYDNLILSAKTKMGNGNYSDAETDLKAALRIKTTDEATNLILQCKYYIFDEIDFGKLKIVRNRTTTLYGAIDERGKEIIPCKYITVDKSVRGRAFLRSDSMYDIY